MSMNGRKRENSRLSSGRKRQNSGDSIKSLSDMKEDRIEDPELLYAIDEAQRSKHHFPRVREIFLQLLKKKVKLNSRFAQIYLESLRNFSDRSVEQADSFVKYLAASSVLCGSGVFIEYVYICRQSNSFPPAENVMDLIKQMNIHRPSFKMLASIITTYCTLAVRSNSDSHKQAFQSEEIRLKRESHKHAQDALDFFSLMKTKYKYVPNTYLFNSVLNMLVKVQLKSEFWDLVVVTCLEERNVPFDAFTYGSIMEMCLIEENYVKMRSVYNEFRTKRYPSDRNVAYVNSLYNRMRHLEKEQMGSIEEILKWRNFGRAVKVV